MTSDICVINTWCFHFSSSELLTSHARSAPQQNRPHQVLKRLIKSLENGPAHVSYQALRRHTAMPTALPGCPVRQMDGKLGQVSVSVCSCVDADILHYVFYSVEFNLMIMKKTGEHQSREESSCETCGCLFQIL